MKFTIPSNHVAKAQSLLSSCGYGSGQVQEHKFTWFKVLSVSHEQMGTRKEMVSFLKDNGVAAR